MKTDLEAALYRTLRFNPCVGFHELRLRMRGVRPFWVLFLYAAAAAAVFLIAMWFNVWESGQTSQNADKNLGRGVFTVIAYTQLVLLLLAVPAYSAGAITMEREKRTLDMLRVTLLNPGDVVSGKLLVVFGLGVMFLLTSLPIACWSLLLGGVAPEEVFYVYTYLLAMAAFAATLGMLFSALLGRSVGAVVSTYGALLALIIIPLVLLGVYVAIVSVQHSSGVATLKLGDIWGMLLVTALGLGAGWLGYLFLRWVWRRLLGPRARLLSYLIPVAVVLVGLFFLLRPGSVALSKVSSLEVAWLFLLEPFLGLAGIMEGANVIPGMFAPTAGRVANLQVLIWLCLTAVTVLAALACWAGAIRVFRVRR